MTVLDNILLNLKGNRFLLDRATAEKRVLALAEKYGLHVNPRARICDLSVGERQRVEILKALYRDVALLILDEPTAVLTPADILVTPRGRMLSRKSGASRVEMVMDRRGRKMRRAVMACTSSRSETTQAG